MKAIIKCKRTMAAIVLCFIMGVTITSCQPQTASSEEKQSPSNTTDQAVSPLSVEWTPDSECSMCHVDQAESSENVQCLSGYHTQNQAFTCITCHADASGLEAVHKGVTNNDMKPSRLKKTTVDQSLCMSCHTDADYEAVAASNIALVDANGKSINPHDTPVTDGHANMTCVSCHTGHNEGDSIENSKEYCLSCHHEDVFECGTCH